ncbi:MAG: response regulator transcription factor [Ilumatobacteraceae bacterium]|jgi:two-component system response regulator DevR|nr:response regulator transcription factor [Ilumatobacteraceae bacterium]
MNLLIVDDHPLVRTGIRTGLEGYFSESSIREAGSVAEALDLLSSSTIDVAILDLRLGDGSGIEIADRIADLDIDTRCVIFTSVITPLAVIGAFNSGTVYAIVEKGVDIVPLGQAVQNAANGLSSLTAVAVKRAEEEITLSGGLGSIELTERERTIAELVADGLSDRDISQTLSLAASTVRNNLSTIYTKLHVESRTQLAILIWRQRSIENPT